ncbi:molybdopterin-dependent oxidoreductase [Anaerovorax odorimutans]|uniref:molybdopterin-dependent oxidoreductase n=1 Tax=Anaerovorax odorimutans TaxID=109327 RepID=UPI0004034195|nr:molybdopterin-dependent oxidoreductase [Anaerovorax odorimutans]
MEYTDKVKKGGKSAKKLILIIVVLILIVVVSWYFSSNNDDFKEGTIVIKAGDIVIGRLTLDDIEKLPSSEIEMKVFTSCNNGCKSSSKDDSKKDGSEDHVYTGTPLNEVLNSIDPNLTLKYKKIITKGVDYYSQVMDMEDVQKPDNIYIVYKDYGKLLTTKDNKEGGMQVIVTGDKYGQRFTKWLVSLELQ